MNWLQRLGRNRLWDAGALVVAALALARLTLVLPTRAADADFANHYAGSRLLWEGRNPYTTPLVPVYERLGLKVTDRAPTVTNPPPLLWLLAPLTAWPVRVAFWVWVSLQTLYLVLVVGLTRWLLRERLNDRAWRFLYAAVVMSPAVFWHFYFSQPQLLLVALVLGAYALLRTGRTATACVLVGTAGMLKLFPFILLPWFIWRGATDWRRRAAHVVVSIGVVGLGVTVAGPSLWRDFFKHAGKILLDWAAGPTYFNFSVPSFVTALGAVWHGSQASPAVLHTWWQAGVIIGWMLIGAVYLVCLRRDSVAEVELSLLIVAMLAGSVMAWGYYFVFLIFPAAVALVSVTENFTWWRAGTLAVALLLLNSLDVQALGGGSLCLRLFLNYLPLAGLIGLGWLLAGVLWRRRESADN